MEKRGFITVDAQKKRIAELWPLFSGIESKLSHDWTDIHVVIDGVWCSVGGYSKSAIEDLIRQLKSEKK